MDYKYPAPKCGAELLKNFFVCMCFYTLIHSRQKQQQINEDFLKENKSIMSNLKLEGNRDK